MTAENLEADSLDEIRSSHGDRCRQVPDDLIVESHGHLDEEEYQR